MRHVIVTKGDDWKMARLVYDWHGYVSSLLLAILRLGILES